MTTKVPLNKISPDPKQPRKKFDETALEELAGSIKENGLIQPIVIRRVITKGATSYLITAGERRWRAHKILFARGLKSFGTIECHVRKAAASADTFARQIAENLSRADLEPMEEARAFAELRDAYGLSVDQIATKLGLATFRVEWRLSLLNLSPPVARMVESGQIDRQLALECARLETHHDQTKLVRLVNSGSLVGWKAVRNAVDAMNNPAAAADLFGPSAPKPADEDVAVLSTMERRIESVKSMVAAGWRNGECIVANRVDPDRAAKMADEINAIGAALRTMERELRNVNAQAKIALS